MLGSSGGKNSQEHQRPNLPSLYRDVATSEHAISAKRDNVATNIGGHVLCWTIALGLPDLVQTLRESQRSPRHPTPAAVANSPHYANLDHRGNHGLVASERPKGTNR